MYVVQGGVEQHPAYTRVYSYPRLRNNPTKNILSIICELSVVTI
jgi:hypothetical protein